MADCSVCCEKYNLQLKTKVTCPNYECNFSCCKSCIRTYIMNSTSDPHCMSCRKPWDQDFIILNLNRNFYEETYKPHRKEILFQREQSKIPDTMNDVSLYLQAREKEKEIKKMAEEMLKYQGIIREINRRRNDVVREAALLKSGKVQNVEKKKFIMPCPGSECKGFLSTAYKCEVCKKHCCPKCLADLGENKDSDHVCDEEMVKTAEYIKSTTKPCPQCGERISKIDGCDQMWCVECHTAFSWRTGLIDKGAVVHNPHYYQYLRNVNNGVVPRNPGDNPCQLDRHMYFQFYRNVHSAVNRYIWLKITNLDFYKNKTPEETNEAMNFIFTKAFNFYKYSEVISNLIRVFNHYNYEIDQNNREIQNNNDFRTLRIQYILNEINKEKMCETMIQKDSKRKKLSEINNILQLIATIGHDIIKRVFEKLMSNNIDISYLKEQLDNDYKTPFELIDIYEEVYNELLKFIEYCNDKLAVVSVSYNINVPHIRSNTKQLTLRPNNDYITDEFIKKYPEKFSEISIYKTNMIQHTPATHKFKIKSVKNMKSC